MATEPLEDPRDRLDLACYLGCTTAMERMNMRYSRALAKMSNDQREGVRAGLQRVREAHRGAYNHDTLSSSELEALIRANLDADQLAHLDRIHPYPYAQPFEEAAHGE